MDEPQQSTSGHFLIRHSTQIPISPRHQALIATLLTNGRPTSWPDLKNRGHLLWDLEIILEAGIGWENVKLLNKK